MMCKYLIICLLLLPFITIEAQTAASLDDNWAIDTSLSDEFSGSSLDNTKWNAFGKSDYPWGLGYCFDNSQVSVSDGKLQLEVIRKTSYDPSCYIDIFPNDYTADFYSGGIQSVDTSYSYGYFEISAKLPGKMINGESNGLGFWPAFWTYYIEQQGSCRTYHDEIDIMEPGGLQYADAKKITCGWHDTIGNCQIDKISRGEYEHDEPLFDDFHKYACEWLPDRIIFYFDDIPFHVDTYDSRMPTHSQFVVIDQQMDRDYPPHDSMTFPQTMEVEYFRYYELNTDSCTQDVSILTDSNLDDFSFGVYKNINIGNGSSSISIVNGESPVFRASNDVIIDGTFTVQQGGELTIIPSPCY